MNNKMNNQRMLEWLEHVNGIESNFELLVMGLVNSIKI